MARRIRDPQSRNQIIEAASRLVAQHGVTATTMRAVAAEAGVSTGSVTHYFEDKAELMEEVLRHTGDLLAQRVTTAVGKRKGLDAAKKATLGLLPLDEERLGCWRIWVAFWAAGPTEPSSDGSFAEGYREWRSLLRRHLQEAIEAGELPAGLDLGHEIRVLGTLAAGTGVLAGANQSDRGRLHRRAQRIFDEHFARLAREKAPEPK